MKKYNLFINLFLGFGLVQLLLHVFYLWSANDPKIIFPTAIALIHDFFILIIYTYVSTSLIRFIPEKYNSNFKNILVIGFILLGTILSLYPKMLREYLIFPSNMFESDLSTAQTLIVEYLGLYSLILQLFVIIWGIYIGFVNKLEFKINKFVILIFSILVFGLAFLSMKQNSPQPLMYTIQMQIESILKNEKRVVQSIKVEKKENHNFIKPITYPDGVISDYDHVLFVVLEGVTAKNFENEFMTFTKGFYAKYIDKSNYYNNYFTNNLDSYTSLIAMVCGIHIPYRSYSDVELYENVNKELNLVDYFNKQGFSSLFVSTFEYQPFIPSSKFWKNIYTRNDFDVTNFVTIGSSRMEKATEDKVAINKIVEYMKEKKRTLIMHELAYGHSPEWRATMGISQLKYYNDFLVEIYEKLAKDSIIDRTLFIIVSDHGDRAIAAEVENYRVPLLVIGKKLNHLSIDDFYSHLDLPYIIFRSMKKDIQQIKRTEIFTVGSSEKWTYGYINLNKEYVFIDNAKGTILSKSANINPQNIKDNFQKYINEFNMKYGKDAKIQN